MKQLMLILNKGMLALSLIPALAALGEDVAPPAWRGLNRSTYQKWDFSTGTPGSLSANNLSPEAASNSYGTAAVTLTCSEWASGWWNSDVTTFGAKQGFWDLGSDSMTVTVPNLQNSSLETVQLQITFFASVGFAQAPIVTISPSATLVSSNQVLVDTTGFGDQWFTVVYTWRINPSPAQDVITISGTGISAVIDQVVVDTQVNQVPTATVATYNRPAGLSLKIALSDLATHWSDVDGDTMALSGINLVTTNLMNLATNSTWILCTNSLNVNDQFTYSISDGQGGTNIGVVNVVVVTNAVGQGQTISVSGSSATVSFAGHPGYTYSVQRSTNLAAWVTIWTTNAPSGGLFEYTDSFGDLGGVPPVAAYYRLNWFP